MQINENLRQIFSGMLKGLFDMGPGIWLILIAALVIAVLGHRKVKGWFGEKLTAGLTRLMLPDEYKMINDVMLPRSDKPDQTTQLDHIVVSRYGLFVIETKNYRGKIYGSENSPVWTYYPGGKKTTFQNPLRQNYLHTRTLADILDIPHEIVRPAVVFCGESSFKQPIADNVGNIRKVADYIKSFKDEIFTPEQVETLIEEIQSGRVANTRANRREHVKGLKR